jgi:hypothetical protein
MMMMMTNKGNSVHSDYATGSTTGEFGFDFRQGQEIFLFFTASRAALVTHSLLSDEYRELFLRGKATGE